MSADVLGAIVVWLAVAIIGVWALAQHRQERRDARTWPYRWKCPHCGFIVKSNEPDITATVMDDHQKSHGL